VQERREFLGHAELVLDAWTPQLFPDAGQAHDRDDFRSPK